MRILILINGLYPERIGGIEVLGADLARLLAARHEVVVYSLYQPGLPVEESRDNYLIRRIKSTHDLKVNVPLGMRTLAMLRNLRSERPRPDIILSMSLGQGFSGYLAYRLFKIPYIAYVLGSDWYIARDRQVAGLSFRLSLKNSRTVITQTSLIRDDIKRLFPGVPIEVIPNGIALPARRADGDKIVYLGRLHPVKGVNHLIDAVRRIPDCPELLIAGDGPDAETLKRRARGAPIRFLGRIDEVEQLYLQGRFFVLPSLSEGLPQAMLEAMSFGLPVIASRVGGVPDVIEHGVTGFLVEPGNTDDLKRHIELLLRDDNLRGTMSDNCIAAVSDYSWDTILDRIERVLQRNA